MAPAPTDPPAKGPSGSRAIALDRLRGIALVGMLVHHLTDWTTGDARAVLPGWHRFALTDAAAVVFFVAAGASMALLVASRRRRGMPRWRVGVQVGRRYGTLVPVGVALGWSLWRSPGMFGVLEALGVTVLLGAAVTAVVPRRALPVTAVALLALGAWSEQAVDGRQDWMSREVVGGKFPVVTYLGFVVVGVAAVRAGWHTDRRRVAGAAVLGLVATAALSARGMDPERYPGDARFVVPGLALTAVAAALAQARWPRALAGVDRVLRRAATHTLGVFVAHYVLYGLLRRAGLLGQVPPALAVPLAVAFTVVACLAAPRLPQLPWSPRTGWRRPRGPLSGTSGRPGTTMWPRPTPAPAAPRPSPAAATPDGRAAAPGGDGRAAAVAPPTTEAPGRQPPP
ncbi:MAG TPA: acyltransferase family protein [Acidimicrobiales bacterium]|nr:acyltransferase family protein [Acidimicrobiales bacterium]